MRREQADKLIKELERSSAEFSTNGYGQASNAITAVVDALREVFLENGVKVFSVEKFVEHARTQNRTNEWIDGNLYSWAFACDGMTKESMNENGYECLDEWLMQI